MPNIDLSVLGGSATIITSGSTYSPITGGYYVVNKASGSATTINLWVSPAAGQMLFLKDGKGDARTNNITIVPASGTIDGQASFVLSENYVSVTLIYNGTEWNVL